MGSTPHLDAGQRLSAEERAALGAVLLERYEAGQTIRDIHRETGYSMGRVRRLLLEAGVEFRPARPLKGSRRGFGGRGQPA